MVYLVISVIRRPHQYVRYIPSSNIMDLFRTFFYNYILVIYCVYTNYKKRYGANP